LTIDARLVKSRARQSSIANRQHPRKCQLAKDDQKNSLLSLASRG
jgi:hypothetical protein